MQRSRPFIVLIFILIPLLFLAFLRIIPRQRSPLSQEYPPPQETPAPPPTDEPPDEASLRQSAQEHRQEKEYAAAIDDLKRLLSTSNDQAQTAYELGLLLAAVDPTSAGTFLTQAGDLDSTLREPALELYRSIRTASLFDEPAYTYLVSGKSLAALGEWDLAREAFSRAVAARPDYAEAWAYLGEARQHVETLSEMPVELETAYNLDPGSIPANLFLAMYYQRQEDYSQALIHLKRAARLDRENPLILTEMGSVLAKSGDLMSARQAYESAAALDEGNPLPWRLLAEFSLTYGIQVRELALPAARRAVLLAPQDPLAHDVLGETFYFLEDYLNAERTLREAIAIDPECAEAHLHLGMVYIVQGSWSRAREEIMRAAELAPGTGVEETAARLLERYFSQ